MPGEPRIRGKVNVVLNGLVSDGAIAGFRTTFGVDNGAGAPLVTVTAPEGQSPHDVKVLVMDALAGVAIGIDVAVEER
jgi:hypothetical protein